LVEGVLNYLIKLHISNPSINPPIAPTTRYQLSLTKYVIFLFKLFIFIYLLYLYIYSPLNSDKIDGLFVSYSSFYISPTIADNNFILRVIFNQISPERIHSQRKSTPKPQPAQQNPPDLEEEEVDNHQQSNRLWF